MPDGQTVSFIPNDGLIRTSGSTFSQQHGFQTLTNARLMPSGGRVEQTPMFYNSAFSAGTYWASSSQMETSTPIRLVVSSNDSTGAINFLFTVSDQSIRSSGTQIQVIRQTTVPAANTANGNLLLVVNNYTTLALTLGNTIDVEIHTDNTHFRWRKNGGAYSADIVIAGTTGQTLDGGSFTIYWLASSGFVVGDLWQWQRTDYAQDSAGTTWIKSLSSYSIGEAIIFVDPSGRVMKYENGGVRSVGYRPVYGSSVVIYANHLFVGSYSTVLTGHNTDFAACSDLNNLDNFYSTDLNEADVFTLNSEQILGHVDIGGGVWHLSIIRNVLYAYNASIIWSTTYQGLPVPFNFVVTLVNTFYPEFQGSAIHNGSGEYLVLTNGIAYFDGSSLRYVDAKIADWFTNPTSLTVNSVSIYTFFKWGFYDKFRREVYFSYLSTNGENIPAAAAGFLVYQEQTDSWFYRVTSFAGGLPYGGCSAGTVNKSVITLGSSLALAIEDLGGLNSPKLDYNTGASYQLPTLISLGRFFGRTVQKTEVTRGYMDVNYQSGPHPNYGTTGIDISFSYTNYVDTAASWSTTPTWTTSKADGSVSYRGNGRVFRFRIVPTVSSSSAAFRVAFNALDLNVLGAPAVQR